MTREEFEAALQTVYEVELGDAGNQWFALLAHDAEQREEIARLRLEQSTAPWGIAWVAALKAEIERLREMRDRLGEVLEKCRKGLRDEGYHVEDDMAWEGMSPLIDEWRAAKAEEAKREEAPQMERS